MFVNQMCKYNYNYSTDIWLHNSDCYLNTYHCFNKNYIFTPETSSQRR